MRASLLRRGLRAGAGALEPATQKADGALRLSPGNRPTIPISHAWLFLLGAAVAAYFAALGPVLPAPFVFDDFSHVLDNRAIRYLAHPRALLESEFSRSRPLPYLTFAISYALHGLSLSWLRAWSLALHLGSALLVGLLFRRWFAGRALAGGGALLAGCLFLLHPLAADSVVYLSARGSVLVLFFLLLALWAHGLERKGVGSFALFFLAAGLAFLSRETAAALLPLTLLAHRVQGRKLKAAAPYLAPLALGGAVLLALKWSYLDSAWRGVFTIQGDVEVASRAEYLRLSLSLWPRLLLLMAAPGSQSLDHQVWLPAGWLSAGVVGGLLAWGFFLFALWRAWSHRSPAWLAPSWIFLTLLPTNSFFPLLDPFAERHFYLALPGLAWAAAWLATRLADPLRGERGRERALRALTAITIALLAGLTLGRARLWLSPVALWADAHAKAPAKFRPAFNAALAVIEETGDNRGALAILSETLARLAPGALTWEQQEQGLGLAASCLRALASEQGMPARELAGALPEGFWRELTLLKASPATGSTAWEKEWSEARLRAGEPPLSPRARDSAWVRHSFALERAAGLERAGKTKEAARAYEEVLLAFSDRHIPFWTAREALADLYLAQGREGEAVEQLEAAAFQYKVFKRFPFQLQRRLYELHLKRGDLARATDAIGELVRVYTDNVPLRRLYADLLAARNDRHAARQTREAQYYESHLVRSDDSREIVRP